MAATQSEWEHLRSIINQWNENRLDLFALCEPTKDLEFHGVMRFYFQEAGQKVATKCIRVSSTATVRAVIDALIEKFHPDMRMLTTPDYSLWEVHEGGDKPERKLSPEEKPLLVQLNWHKDDREGRFLLKREGEDYLPLNQLQTDETNAVNPSMKRKLSRREKKEMKKQQKRDLLSTTRSHENLSTRSKEAEDVAQKLYTEVPPTTFTRTISNPEIVMKKRRERKLAQKLLEMGEGGSLKVYGTDLSEEKPYVTLLVSNRDKAEKLVRETMEKYGLERSVDPADFCLVEALLPASENENENTKGHVSPLRQRILDDEECPLQLLSQLEPFERDNIIFHVKHRPSDMPRKSRRKPRSSTSSAIADNQGPLPCLVELNADSSEVQGNPKVIQIQQNVTEVGSDRALAHSDQSLPLFGPYVHPRHCVLAFMDGVVTITPCTSTAQIEVNGHPISETTILRNGFLLRIGRSHVFRFLEPGADSSAPPLINNVPRSQSMPNRVMPGKAGMPAMPSAMGNAQWAPPVGGRDAIPAIIELLDNAEDAFLSAVIRDVHPGNLQFKLAPVYMLYASWRYRVSPHYRTSLLLAERLMKLNDFLTKTTNLLHVTVQDHCHDAEALAFWMANTSEVLNLAKLDRDLGPATRPEPQESLADCVEKAFAHLTACLKQDLNQAMPAFLDPNLDDSNGTAPCLHMLSGAMNLLRHCRVNAALTIQLFSQLFYHINMYLFNWLVSREGAGYCCRSWGQRLARRLAQVQSWAFKQGLELAAECHLDKIIQAIKLLESPKSMDQLATLGGTCYKLNSVQVRSLLERYRVEPGEPPLESELIDNVVKLAENQADDNVLREGRNVQVEEEMDLQLPFLLPEDGYSPDSVKFIPSGLQEFVNSLLTRGICRMIVQPSSSGSWTVHLNPPGSVGLEVESEGGSGMPMVSSVPLQEAEIVQISFSKAGGGIGLSIVAAQGAGQPDVGIYVKKVVPGSAADKDGRLQAGDQLLKVNGQSLVGISQEEAALRMAQSGNTVSFEVAKQAAVYNGLATWLYQPSPDMHNPATVRQNLGNQSVPHQQPQYIPNGQAGMSGHQRFSSQSGYPVHRQLPEHSRAASLSHLENQVRMGPAGAGSASQLSAGPLRHDQDYQNLYSQHHERSPRTSQQAGPRVNVQAVPNRYGQNPMVRGDGINPPAMMSQSAEYPRRISPVQHNQRLQQYPNQSPVDPRRRPPSVDEAGLYRAHSQHSSALQSPSASSVASAFSVGVRSPSVGDRGVVSFPTDYQNLPLTQSPHAITQHAPFSPSARMSSNAQVLRNWRPEMQLPQVGIPRVQIPDAAAYQHSPRNAHPQRSTENAFLASQEPYRLPTPAAYSTGVASNSNGVNGDRMRRSVEFQQGDFSPETQNAHRGVTPTSLANEVARSAGGQVWAREEQEQREKEIDDEVIRLMREQADMLEQKEFLTEAEERRYRALKYELTYQERLKSELNRRSSEEPNPAGGRLNDDANILGELGEFEPAVSRQELGEMQNPNRIAAENRKEILDRRLENMEQNVVARQQAQEEYYSRAEEKIREEAMKQRHQAEMERMQQEMLSRAAMEAEEARERKMRQAEEEQLALAKAEMHSLQTHMGGMTVGGEIWSPPPINGHLLNGNGVHHPPLPKKPPPPEVPPKRKVVFHETPQESSFHDPSSMSPPILSSEDRTLAEMEILNRKYVYQKSEEEQPRTQILGAQEVYRDPRQERLHKIHQQQAQKNPSVDGSNLDFKSKMRMFAKQLGETTPNDRMKVSRAQRDIEDHLQTPNSTHE